MANEKNVTELLDEEIEKVTGGESNSLEKKMQDYKDNIDRLNIELNELYLQLDEAIKNAENSKALSLREQIDVKNKEMEDLRNELQAYLRKYI